MSTITLRLLKLLRACQGQVDLFENTFGESVEVTVDLARQHASTFDFQWLAERTLKAPALAEYDRVKPTAWAEYERVKPTAWAEQYMLQQGE